MQIENRKARHNFEILETYEAGIELIGSEVKSIRAGKASMNEAFARVIQGEEIWLFGLHITRYENTDARLAPDEARSRRLLMRKKEIYKIAERVRLERLAITALKLYFNKRNRVKIQIALARGKKLHDKREAIKERDVKIDLKRVMKKSQK
ncbi:MAG: SsrA-binding protein SmpB [Helicobacteraceae bacterium]|jgi:SsrA-binding protein|nr:SsrA-binding protein SmpB [Helicobacteraceae bacterium]